MKKGRRREWEEDGGLKIRKREQIGREENPNPKRVVMCGVVCVCVELREVSTSPVMLNTCLPQTSRKGFSLYLVYSIHLSLFNTCLVRQLLHSVALCVTSVCFLLPVSVTWNQTNSAALLVPFTYPTVTVEVQIFPQAHCEILQTELRWYWHVT